MSLRYKTLYSVDPADLMKSNLQVHLQVIGLFDTHKVIWTYHVVSIIKNVGILQFTDDICLCSYNFSSADNVKLYGMKFEDIESAKKYIDDFKIKWETGSNNTTQEIRDQKLKELTDES